MKIAEQGIHRRNMKHAAILETLVTLTPTRTDTVTGSRWKLKLCADRFLIHRAGAVSDGTIELAFPLTLKFFLFYFIFYLSNVILY
jgi:hypothetical protein